MIKMRIQDLEQWLCAKDEEEDVERERKEYIKFNVPQKSKDSIFYKWKSLINPLNHMGTII